VSTKNDIKEVLNREYDRLDSNLKRKHFRGQSANALREYFFKLSEILDLDLLIEVGAHSAETSVRFLSSPNRTAIAYEANPSTFEKKTKLAASHGVVVRNEGVSSIAGQANFFIPVTDSQGLMPENASFRRKSDQKAEISIPVNVTTVDRIIEKQGNAKKIGLWIDAEGLGLEVLEGAVGLLSGNKCHLVMVEVELREYWVGQAEISQVENLLQSHGFVQCLIDMESEFQRNLIYVRGTQRGVSRIQEQFINDILKIKTTYPCWLIKYKLLSIHSKLKKSLFTN
jgi:FkbM family methyltransferase